MTESIDEAVTARMYAYVDAYKDLDIDRIVSFYSKNPKFKVYADGQAFDRDGLIALVKDLLNTLSGFLAKWEYVEVTPLGDNAALAAAKFTRDMTETSGNVTADWGTVTWVWVREGDEWMLIHGQGVHYPYS